MVTTKKISKKVHTKGNEKRIKMVHYSKPTRRKKKKKAVCKEGNERLKNRYKVSFKKAKSQSFLISHYFKFNWIKLFN